MDYNKYKTLLKLGGVPIKSMGNLIKSMLDKELINKDMTIEDLLELCNDFCSMTVVEYKDRKLEQNYGNK